MQQQMIARAQGGIQQQFGERGRQLQRAFAQRGISGAARQRLEQDLTSQRTAALTGSEQDVIRKRAMQRGADIRSGLGAVMPLLQLGQRASQFSASQRRGQPPRQIGQPSGTWGLGPAGGGAGAFQRGFLGAFQQQPPGGLVPQFAQGPRPPRQQYAFPPGISPSGAF